MNYRTLYKKHYGIKFGRDYEVHHIDLNHENDDIENLLLLPSKLHHQYHFALTQLPISNGMVDVSSRILSVTEQGNQWNNYALTMFSEFVDVYYECQKWADYKHYLDGEIPNIHGIQLGGAA